MLITFDEIIELTLEHEGGYVHDPKDLGGETNFGIAKRFYPDVDIKNLTKEGAKDIYRKDYWDKNKVDDLPDNLKHIFLKPTNHL
jgi:lysozyme family protein